MSAESISRKILKVISLSDNNELNNNTESNTESTDETVNDELNDNPEEQPKKESSFFGTIRNIFLGLILLAVLIVGGFIAAVKYGVLTTENVAMLNEELGLYRLPIVGNGRYFEVPEGVEWPPKEPEPEAESEKNPEPEPAVEEKPAPKATEVKIDKKAIDEQRAQREAEEKKRVARLAKIYENMKPEAAANALINVDWDTTVLILQRMSEDSVANILAKMEPEAAAQLTEMLFAGTQRRVTTPYDTMRNEPVNSPEQLSYNQ
ncbi:MAG: hypothetical protein IKZ53_08970 [Selenomonadaceae bacterium]|nr:hypothetical protein [Selenomonadaceae bacterium]